MNCAEADTTAGVADGPGLGLERSSEAALQAMVYGVANFGSMDELMLYNALALRRRQLLRLQAADEWSEVLEVCLQLGCVNASCRYKWKFGSGSGSRAAAALPKADDASLNLYDVS